MRKLPEGICRRKNRPGFYVRDQRGGRDRWIKAGSTLDEAKRTRDRVRGSTLPVARVTVAEAAALWLERDVALSRNDKGRKLAAQRVANDLVPALGMRPLGFLTREDCRVYRLALEAREPRRNPLTIAHLLSDFRRMLNWAEDAGLVDRSPFPRRLLPRIEERPPDRLTDDEVRKLVSLAEPWGFYLRFLFGTGLRWGEASRAQAHHVDREHLVVARTKTGRVRRVPLSPALLAEVRGRVGLLFHIGGSWGFNLRVCRLSGIERFHAHQTRHTFSCRWLESGGSITALQEVLGHSSVRTTQRYGRPNEEAIRREAERSWG